MPYKLLLADDSVTIQRVIELTFADEDIQVVAVGDGKQAIERIEAERPDIVLADVGMPERDGYDVASFVKTTAHLSHIPVLLLTGAFEPIDEQRASAVGCDGVLAKPFEPHMVITRVKALLGASGAPAGGRDSAGRAEVSPVERGDTSPAPLPDAAEPAGPEEDETSGGVLARLVDEPAGEAPLRISRRTPIAVPGFGAPAPPSESLAAIDEYFDRLDAAFATLQQTPPAPPPAFDSSESGGAGADGAPADAPPPPAEAVPAGQASGPEPGQRAEPEQAVAAPPRAPAQVPGIAQAFSALFAAERGEPAGEVPAFVGQTFLPQASIDELAERVTRQVLERMSDRVVRDTVTDVVSRVAERLVRDEIERVKATLK